jgi:hypothetical protein
VVVSGDRELFAFTEFLEFSPVAQTIFNGLTRRVIKNKREESLSFIKIIIAFPHFFLYKKNGAGCSALR